MKHLIIIGAGGYGRELFGLAREAVGFGVEFDIKGYLDDRLDALKGFSGYPPVLGTPEAYSPEPDDVFVAALGDVGSRRRCVRLVESRGGRFIPIIHRSASIGPNCVIGDGAVVAQFACVMAEARIGRHAAVFQSSVIGHDSSLGDYAHVYSLCSIGGSVRLESGAVVYPGAVVTPRRTVGADAVVGAGSTVILNVKAGSTVFGSPAAPVKSGSQG